MNLLAVSSHNHLKHPPADASALPPATRAALLDDLSKVARLAHRLKWAKAIPDAASRYHADYVSLQSLLPWDIPRMIKCLESGWYAELERRIQHDRDLLGVSVDVGRNGSVAILPPAKTGPASFVFELPPGESSAIFVAPQRCEDLSSRTNMHGIEGRNRCIEILLQEQLQWHHPAGWKLESVEIREDQRVPGPNMRVLGWLHPGGDRSQQWLQLQVQVPPRGNFLNGIAATLWMHSGGASHNGQPHAALKPDDFWRNLTQATSDHPAFVTYAAGLLWRIANEPRQRRWQEVYADAERVVKQPAQVDSRLLGELASHNRTIKQQSLEERALLMKCLLMLVPLADWAEVRRFVVALAVDIDDAPSDMDRLYKAILSKAPPIPGDDDLRFLLAAAQELKVPLARSRSVTEALRAFCARHGADDRVLRGCLQLLVDDCRPARNALNFSLPLEHLCDCVRNAAPADLAGVIADLHDPLVAMHTAGLPPAELDTFLKNSCQETLLRDLPNPNPGVWLTDDQQKAFLKALLAFGELVTCIGVTAWDPTRLASVHAILPRLGADPLPSRYPSTYWGLVRAWLCRLALDNRGFQREGAVWLLRYELSLAASHPNQPQLDVKDAHHPLCILGAWLRSQHAPAAVHRALADLAIESVQDDPGSTDAVADALLRVSPHDQTARKKLQTVVRRLFQLDPWTGRLDVPLRTWLVDTLLGSASLSTLTLPALRGLLHASGPEDLRKWQELLSALPVATDHQWDVCLAEFDVLAESAALAANAEEALKHLSNWLSAAAASQRRILPCYKIYMEWHQWLNQHAALLSWLPRHQPLAVLSGCLCSSSGKAQERVRRLWPGVPTALLLRGDKVPLAEFVRLCKRTGKGVTEEALHTLAIEVAAQLEVRPSCKDVLNVLETWMRTLGVSAASTILVRFLWPKLPAQLIAANDVQQLRVLHDVMPLFGPEITAPMRLSLAAETMVLLAGKKQKVELLDRLELLAAFFDRPRRQSWNKVARIARANPTVSPEGLLRLASALFVFPKETWERALRAEAWRQAELVRETNASLASELVAL